MAGYRHVSENVTVPEENSDTQEFHVSCPGGRSVFGGGYLFDENLSSTSCSLFEWRPSSGSVWRFRVSNETREARR